MNGFVLAGGQSSRMGRDKALLELGGRPLIAIALDRLRSLKLQPRICGARPDLAGFAPVIADTFPGCGPLAGIEAGLAGSDAELNLFLAVDLPLMAGEFLRWMLARAQRTGAAATIPVWGGRPQPLCGVYRKSLAPRLHADLERGNYKVMAALAGAASPGGGEMDLFQVEQVAVTLAGGEWPAQPPMREWFRNLNTPEDYEALPLRRRVSAVI